MRANSTDSSLENRKHILQNNSLKKSERIVKMHIKMAPRGNDSFTDFKRNTTKGDKDSNFILKYTRFSSGISVLPNT